MSYIVVVVLTEIHTLHTSHVHTKLTMYIYHLWMKTCQLLKSTHLLVLWSTQRPCWGQAK